MRKKRMLRSSLITEEKFRALPSATQMLYVHMAMDADDDGFIPCAKEYCKRRGYSPRRLSALEDIGYVISFPSGVCALTHWCACNNVPPEHYKPTGCGEELSRLRVSPDGIYRVIQGRASAEDTL